MVPGCLAVEPASCPAVGNRIPSLRYGRVTVVSKSRCPQSNARRGGRSSALYLSCVVTCRLAGHLVSGLTGQLTPTVIRMCTRQPKEVL